jgi:hypothetical protein
LNVDASIKPLNYIPRAACLLKHIHSPRERGITFARQVNQAQEDIVIMRRAVLFTRLSLTGDTPKRNKLQQKAGAQRARALIAKENCVIF